jgi:hypothetical protein
VGGGVNRRVGTTVAVTNLSQGSAPENWPSMSIRRPTSRTVVDRSRRNRSWTTRLHDYTNVEKYLNGLTTNLYP